MSGNITIVKTYLLEVNSLALYSPCSVHSFNRVAVNAATPVLE
jgi:hypothetical protein